MKIILKKIFEEITVLGGLMFFLLFSFWFLIQEKFTIFIVLILGQFIIYLIILIFRLFYFKHRPNRIKYRTLLEKLDANSFPSIHAARIVFLFIFLVAFVVKNIFFISLLFILTLLVLYSRIYLKKHYLIDVIGGVILGIITSLLFFIV